MNPINADHASSLRFSDTPSGIDPREEKARQALGVLSDLAAVPVFQRFSVRLPAAQIRRTWARLAETMERGGLPLRMGELFGPMSNTVNSWAWTAGSPRAALAIVSDFWHLASSVSRCEIVDEAGRVGVRYVMLHGLRTIPDDAAFRLSGWLTMLRSMTSRELRPVHAAFAFPEPEDTSHFVRIFACPLRWGAKTSELWFDAADLEPAHPWNARLHAPAPDFWERGQSAAAAGGTDLLERVEHVVALSLERGEAGIKFCAPRLGMSPRTLVRRLRHKGIAYRLLVERVRQTRAAQLVQDRDLSLAQIAAQLGYSNTQNFTRAFQRWYRTTPGEARKHGPQQRGVIALH